MRQEAPEDRRCNNADDDCDAFTASDPVESCGLGILLVVHRRLAPRFRRRVRRAKAMAGMSRLLLFAAKPGKP
jgi:hypothetical protein